MNIKGLLGLIFLSLLAGYGDLAAGEFEKSDTAFQTLLAEGASKYLAGDLDGAIDIFKEAVEFYPHNIGGHNALASVYIKKAEVFSQNRDLKSFQRFLFLAERQAETALAIDSLYPGALYNRGLIDLKLQKYDLARASFLKVVELAPDNIQAYLGLGNVLYQDPRADSTMVDSAIGVWQAGLARDISLVAAGAFHLNIGAAFYARGYFEKAATQFAQALTTEPDNPEVLYRLGIAYASSGNFDSAAVYYLQALDREPNLAKAYVALSQDLYIQNDLMGALKASREALNILEKQNDPGRIVRLLLNQSHLFNTLTQLARNNRDFQFQYGQCLKITHPAVTVGNPCLYEKLCQLEDDILAYQTRAYRADTSLKNNLMTMTTVFYEQGGLKALYDRFASRIDSAPRDCRAHFEMALFWNALADIARRERDNSLRKIKDINPQITLPVFDDPGPDSRVDPIYCGS